MITIDNGRCNGCGLCAKICHEHCIVVEDTSAVIDYSLCSTCCQCIAICPTQVFSWDGIASIPFNTNNLPSAELMSELLGQRRTVRTFKNERLDRNLLEEIAAAGIYAPTHNFKLRVIIVDDDSLLEAMDTAVFRFSRMLYYWIYKNPITGSLAKLAGPAMRNEFMKAKPKLEHTLKQGRAHKFHPPVVIFIVGDKRVPLSLESAQYALYNMILYSMTKHVACQILVGNQMIYNRNKKLRKKLRINRREKIFATMGVGFPAIRFRNRVIGKRMTLSWNGRTL